MGQLCAHHHCQPHGGNSERCGLAFNAIIRVFSLEEGQSGRLKIMSTVLVNSMNVPAVVLFIR